MMTFDERFKGRIDMTDGTVVLCESGYKQIQRDALLAAFNAISAGIGPDMDLNGDDRSERNVGLRDAALTVISLTPRY